MCFSATASFTASTVLGVVGVATIHKTTNRRALLLSAVPLIFAFQQFIEGWIWISLGDQSPLVLPLTHIFLFFAFFFWPIYMPLTVLMLEPSRVRRIIIAFFLAGGAIVGTILYANFLADPVAAWIVNKCLFYTKEITRPESLKYFYIVFTVGSGLVSSQMIIKIFCLLSLVGAIITYYFFVANFTSVWCFFAAIISAVLFFYPQKSSALK